MYDISLYFGSCTSLLRVRINRVKIKLFSIKKKSSTSASIHFCGKTSPQIQSNVSVFALIWEVTEAR